ncbi:hypothetical protein ACOSQ3_013457 [Xanthoceras sorbifolium]
MIQPQTHLNEAIPNTPLERSEVIRTVIVRICKERKRDNGVQVQLELNGTEKSSAKKKPAGREKGGGAAASSEKKGGRGSGTAAKRKR